MAREKWKRKSSRFTADSTLGLYTFKCERDGLHVHSKNSFVSIAFSYENKTTAENVKKKETSKPIIFHCLRVASDTFLFP